MIVKLPTSVFSTTHVQGEDWRVADVVRVTLNSFQSLDC
jgi:hypothetical protein